MSALSEALERQLRKVMPLPKVAVAPKVATSATRSISLAYQEGSSDKVYHVQLVETKQGFEVHFQYGRRGKTLIRGVKTSSPMLEYEAERIYYKLVDEKTSKGYKEI